MGRIREKVRCSKIERSVDMKKKNAFTLIELIAVLVILAVITLIVTPLVLNIVKKAKDSANKRSVDAYGKAVELAVATYLLDNGDYPTSLDNLTVEYSGNELVCNVKNLNEDGSIYLSECSVAKTEVKDSSTEDGYYHYGKLSVNYDVYNIGDIVTYNEMDFYVIANSDSTSDSVTLLKAEPLKSEEMKDLILSTEIADKISLDETYLKMLYFYNDACSSTGIVGECSTEYDLSSIKQVVDVWGNNKLNESDLSDDDLGYKTRLLSYEELMSNLGYMYSDTGTGHAYRPSNDTPKWVIVQTIHIGQ